MISYARKTHTNKPPPAQVEDNRFEQIRRQAAERHRRSDTDSTLRRSRQAVKDNRIL